MTPTLQQFQELETKHEALLEVVRQMQNATSISPDFNKVLEKKSATTSSKVATSENKSVNEGGAAVYSVLKAPVGFILITIGGTAYYVPYFNA